MMFRILLWNVIAFVVWAHLVSGCAPTVRGEYPRNDCRAGGEFTYHSDGAWDATVRSECGRGW
jgi:hypothetical protein